MTADNLNNVRVIPDLLVINENVRPRSEEHTSELQSL